MAAVSLHPLASRKGTQSATVVSVQIPAESDAESPLGKYHQQNDHRHHIVTDATGEEHAQLSTPTLAANSATFEQQTPCPSRTTGLTSPHVCETNGSYISQQQVGHSPEESQLQQEEEHRQSEEQLQQQQCKMQQQASYGIVHHDLDQYPVLDDGASLYDGQIDATSNEEWFPYGKPPAIRAMTAAQYNELHERYINLDVPSSAVFPFLHGVDGDNQQQNMFFGAPPDGMPAPNYRGLTIVRADMPALDQQNAGHSRRRNKRASSSASLLSELATMSESRSRADSLATTASSSAHSYSSSRSSDGERDLDTSVPTPNGARAFAASASTSSVASSTAPSEQSRASSIFSTGLLSEASTEASSLQSDAYKVSAAAGFHARASRNRMHRDSPPIYDPQPEHSFLTSSIMPSEILSPPYVADGKSKHLQPVAQNSPLTDDCYIQAPSFCQPPQCQGISLRNFKIQCAKYATISDIVIYCPAGLHEGALTLARWFREAHEALFEDRCERGLACLRYNVFIVTDPFEMFERHHPHLVAIDGSGYSRNRVDFVERERDEMQRMSTASEIDDNVWMGCTADAPAMPDDTSSGTNSSYSLDSCPPEEANPHGFAICIEAHDGAQMPQPVQLTQAANHIGNIEAEAIFELNSKGSLQELEEDDSIYDDDHSCGSCEAGRGSISLGPNGWSPQCRAQNGSYRRSVAHKTGKEQSHGQQQQQQQQSPLPQHQSAAPFIYHDPSNVFNFECVATLAGMRDVDQIIEDIVTLCVWIKKQACPPKVSSNIHSQGSAPLHSSFRGMGYGRHGTSTWSPGMARSILSSQQQQQQQQQQIPRRILIHCGDGYTETSILGLAYLMYSRELSLPEAYLDLQNRCQRSFFVYGKDMAPLRKLEKRISQEIKYHQRVAAEAAERDATRSSKIRHSFGWSVGGSQLLDELQSPSRRAQQQQQQQHDSRQSSRRSSHSRRNSANSEASSQEQSVWARGLAAASGLVGGSQTLQSRKSGSHCNAATPVSVTASSSTNSVNDINRASTPTPASTNGNAAKGAVTPAIQDHSWFQNPRFEGSFPSRILPFLYLGNLNHALNPSMLFALGITHVVSVGESALIPPQYEAASYFNAWQKSDQKIPLMPEARNSLWVQQQIGNISVLDLKNVSDDGIDSLRPYMHQAIEYIEQARLQGGKVLVHCRVGVSRSATICIAMVMAHLDLSMIEAFLFVRSRRMNVLTQPTLLFVWELRGFESQLAKLKNKRASRARRRSSAMMTSSLSSSSSNSFDSNCAMVTSPNNISLADLSISKGDDGSDSPSSSSSTSASTSPGTSLSANRKRMQRNELQVDIGAGAGSVYASPVADYEKRPFGSGSLTRLPYASAKLTHGYFSKLLSELNARYSVA